jgi:hypothetical protein
MTQNKPFSHTISSTQPTALRPGDEWYNVTTNKLYKALAVNGARVEFVEVGSQGPQVTSIPQSVNTTVVSGDTGKYLNVAGTVTVDTFTNFLPGNIVSIYNNSASNITVTATGVTLRVAGTATTGNRTIAQRGLVTILCVAPNEYVITGAGLS